MSLPRFYQGGINIKVKEKFNLREILKFLVGGGSAVLVDFLVYNLFLFLGAETWVAKTVSYITGAAVGFVINKFWTFGSRSFHGSEIVKYIILYAVSAAANALVNSAVIALLGWKLFAFLAATGTSTIMNFFGQKFFVFRGTNNTHNPHSTDGKGK